MKRHLLLHQPKMYLLLLTMASVFVSGRSQGVIPASQWVPNIDRSSVKIDQPAYVQNYGKDTNVWVDQSKVSLSLYSSSPFVTSLLLTRLHAAQVPDLATNL